MARMTTRWQQSVADEVAEPTSRVTPAVGGGAPWPPPVPLAAEASSRGPGVDDRVFDVSVRTADADAVGAVAERHWLELIFFLGLAGVFLANALVGRLEPSGFTKLAQESRVGAWLQLGKASWLVPLICVNDLLVGVGLLVAIWSRGALRRLVLAWAGLWLLAVTVLKLTALGVPGV